LGFPTGWLFTTHKDCLLHINITASKDYSHMMMEMKLTIDGDDGGEDGPRSPPSGEKSWIDLIPESMIVALAALYFANSLPLVDHPLFDIYEGVHESWRRGGA
jgi:hypothetical protein